MEKMLYIDADFREVTVCVCVCMCFYSVIEAQFENLLARAFSLYQFITVCKTFSPCFLDILFNDLLDFLQTLEKQLLPAVCV